jgi:hypothetical protein
MKQPTFTKEHEDLLRAQVIDADRPGPILHDFQTVLDFLAPAGVKAAGKYNLLPLDVIKELDQKLARPLRLDLNMKRPQLRSHPYLQGLHLLLRATGLTRVEGRGDKARLVIDPTVLGVWNQLNPTERYFSLLEAWLVVGQPEMIGEYGRWGEGYLMACVSAWNSVPARGIKFDLTRPQDAHLGYLSRGFLHVALMDLFGVMEVKFPDSPVQPWCPAAVKHRPFGDALFSLLWRETAAEDKFFLTVTDYGAG